MDVIMTSTRLAIVTGCENTIMLAVARELCKHFDGDVILTARYSNSCMCVNQLKEEGYRPMFLKLDTTDTDDVERLSRYIKHNYRGIDVLFHNAAIVTVPKKNSRFSDGVTRCLLTNFFGTMSLVNTLWRLLNPHARTKSTFSECSSVIQAKLQEHNDSKRLGELGALMEEFLREGQKGSHYRLGWPTDAFGMSQVATVVLVNILAREALEDYRGDVVINSCIPSHKTTDIFGYNMPLSRRKGLDIA